MTAEIAASHRDILEALTASGPRVIGSASANRALEMIRNELALAGYVVTEHRFEMPAWDQREPGRVQVISPDKTVLECQPMLWSGATPSGGVTGHLVAVGQTRLWEGSYVWLKFAVVEGEALVGYLLVHEGGHAIMQPCPPGSDPAVPHIVIARADGDRLTEWLRDEARVTVCLDAPVETGGRGGGVSLLASLPDRGPQAGQPLTCAHYDTVFNTPLHR